VVPLEDPASQEHLAQWAHRDLWVLPDPPELLVTLALQGRRVQQDSQGHKGHRGRRAQPDRRAMQVELDLPDHQDHQVPPEG